MVHSVLVLTLYSYSMPYAPGSMPSSQSDDYIWALKDVFFEMKREEPEIAGITGRNGVGRSRILKILFRITELKDFVL